jgi:DNA-binding transcriptional LysR family regulator
MTNPEVPPPAAAPFRLLVVPGVTPAKWVRVWRERLPDVPLELVQVPVADQDAALRDGRADAGFVRLPVDRDALSAIPLWTEATVVVVPRDHWAAAADTLAPSDLAEETLLVPDDDVLAWADAPGEASALPAPPATTAQAVELVAAGVGLVIVPQSLARLHHRRDVTYVPLDDAPASQVALAWATDRGSDLIEELVGIVRGRTVNSSRGRGSAVDGADGAGEHPSAVRPAKPRGTTKGAARVAGDGRPRKGRGSTSRSAGKGKRRR